MEKEIYIGIDVSKDTLDVAVHGDKQHWSFANDEAGITKIVSKLRQLNPELVVLEATGGFEVALAADLGVAKIPTAVVNPRPLRDFAKSVGMLAKTDILDARIIARFAATVKPPPHPIPDIEARELGAITARRGQIVNMITAEKNRLSTASKTVKPRIRAHINWLEKELNDVNRNLRQKVKDSPIWQEKDNFMQR